MARTREHDLVEKEALKIGYGILLNRVNKSLEVDNQLKAVLEHQRKDITKRLTELEGGE